MESIKLSQKYTVRNCEYNLKTILYQLTHPNNQMCRIAKLVSQNIKISNK